MRKIIYLFLFIIIISFFLLYPKDAFLASSHGILLWFEQILPTLLPFSILSNIILSSNLFEAVQRFMKRKKFSLGSISPEEWFIIICGFLFGFPIGSKLTADVYQRGLISYDRAQTLCAFTNNLSPVFVSGFVCNSQFGQPAWIIPTYAVLYGPPFLIGIFFLVRNKQTTIVAHKKSASRFQIDMQILDAGIINGFETLIKLCGYIVIFSLVVSILTYCRFLPSFVRMLLIGNTEVTNGISVLSNYICNTDIKFILMIQFLAFGGVSGIAQTSSMILPAKLSIKKYVIEKMIFVFCSTILATVMCLFF